MIYKSIYNFFKSIKLSIVIILLIIVFSIIATFIPQNLDSSFYKAKYPEFLSFLILTINLNKFFNSLLFFILIIIFSLNLLTCSIHRVVKRFKAGNNKRFGPDLIHLGILILVIGLTISLNVYERKEKLIYLMEGDSVQLSDELTLYLKKYEFLTYEDGRPKDWLSTVEIRKEKEVIKSEIIEVNNPLRIGSLSIYQSSYNTEHSILIESPDGKKDNILENQGFEIDDGKNFAVYKGNIIRDNEMTAIFHKQGAKESILKDVYELKILDKIGNYKILDINTKEYTGLGLVEDRSFPVVLISLIIIGFGLALTFIKKIRDGNL